MEDLFTLQRYVKVKLKNRIKHFPSKRRKVRSHKGMPITFSFCLKEM